MKNKNGFTLIEVIAVIVIIGVVMLIAVPSVSTIIMNSRKKTYIVDANRYIEGAKNFINTNDLNLRDETTTFYIPKTCLDMDKSQESPFGDWKDVFVVVAYDGYKYQYYYASTDTEGMGITLTHSSQLKNSSIKTNVNSISTEVGVGERDNIVIFANDCNLETAINDHSIEPTSYIEEVESTNTDEGKEDNYNITSLTYSPTDWVGIGDSNKVVLTGKAKDVKNGITHYCFSELKNTSGLVCSNSNGEWTENTNSDPKDEITATFDVIENGTYYFNTLDGKGKISTKSIRIYNIDKQAPECSISSNNTRFICTDNNGVMSYYVGPRSTPSYIKVAKTVKLQKDISLGTGSYYLFAKDVAGNEYYQVFSVNTNDLERPSVVITSTNKAAANQSLTIDIYDRNAIDKYYFGTKNPESETVEFTDVTGNPKNLTKNETISAAGVYYAAAKDKDGNLGVSNIRFRTINATSNNEARGGVSPKKQFIRDGGQVVIKLNPKKGFKYSSNTCGGTVVGNTLTINNNSADLNCNITFTGDTYTVNVSSNNTSYGSVSPTTQTVTKGDDAVITLSPNTGYGYASDTCGGKVVGNQLIISNVTAAKTCAVTFSGNTYLVSATSNNSNFGTVTPAQQYIVKGNNATFTLTPTAGFSYKSNDCGGTVSGNVLTVKNITSAKTCAVVFESNKFTVTATSNNNNYGTVTPSSQSIDYDGTALINLSPKIGYEYKSNNCGATVASSNILQLSNVKENKSCQVTFGLIEYTVKAVVAKTSDNKTHGTVTPATQTVQYGKAATINLSPESGYYYISDDCGGTLNAAKTVLTVSNVVDNKTCTILYGKNFVIVTAKSNNTSFGTVSPASQNTPIGEFASILIDPKYTYEYGSNDCGATLTNNGQLTLSNVTTAKNCTVTFKKIRVTLTYNSNGGSNCSALTVDMGSAWGTLCAPTRTGYTFVRWYNSSGTTVNSSTTALGNVPVTAEWKIHQNTLTVNANSGTGGGTWKQNYNTTKAISVARTGYTFTGWTKSGTCNTIGSGTSFTYTYPANDGTTCTITANWTINKNTLKVNANSGTGGGTWTQNYNTTKAVSVSRTGYSLGSWTKSGTCNTVGSASFTYTFPANSGTTCSLTANWNINRNTLKVDANGGSGGGTWTQNYNTTKGVSVSKSGHTFTGWTKSGTCNSIGGGSSFTYRYPANSGTTCTIKANWRWNPPPEPEDHGCNTNWGGCWCGECDCCCAEVGACH